MTHGQDSSDQAEHWYQRMHAADCTAQERTAFQRWYDENPAHAVAYDRTGYLFERAAELRFDPQWRSLAQVARQRTARAGAMRRVVRWTLPAAAALVLAVGIGWQVWNPAQPEARYATAVGERRTIALDDGSQVVLDTDSVLVVQYSRKRRDLSLERGQAQFSVKSQPRRPFVVSAGGGLVRAVGTLFQVRREDASVQVTLLEGVVTVSGPASSSTDAPVVTLAAGEQLRYGKGRLGAPQRLDLAMAQGWTRGELVFDRRPLAEVIAEMNRYTTTKIQLGDPSLSSLPVSGAFYDSDQASFVRALEVGWSLSAERVSPNEIVLRTRQ